MTRVSKRAVVQNNRVTNSQFVKNRKSKKVKNCVFDYPDHRSKNTK